MTEHTLFSAELAKSLHDHMAVEETLFDLMKGINQEMAERRKLMIMPPIAEYHVIKKGEK